MKIWITGAGGFIGSYLSDYFATKHEVVATYYDKGFSNIEHLKGKITMRRMDVNDRTAVEDFVRTFEPDWIFHMAAQSYVLPSWKDPTGTLETNVIGTLNILEALRKNNLKTKLVLACSSAEYGVNLPDEIPIKENKEFRPTSPYAVSKIGQDMLGYIYWANFGINVLRVRYFNIVGPRKTGNAFADFAKGIAEIEKGKESELGVGDLSNTVDMTDVEDAVAATAMIAEKGTPGEVYNVCTGRGHKVSEVLDLFIAAARKKINVVADPQKKRPKEDPIFVGDNTKLRALGWKPKIEMSESVRRTLEYWRKRLSA